MLIAVGGFLISILLGVAFGSKLLLNLNIFASPIFYAIWSVFIVAGALITYVGIKSQN